MSENEPFLRLEADGNQIEMNRRNTTLITHMAGKVTVNQVEYDTKHFNHIWVVTQRLKDGGERGVPLFEDELGDRFGQVANYLAQNDFYMVLNRPFVTPQDLQCRLNYDQRRLESEISEIPDELPDNFS